MNEPATTGETQVSKASIDPRWRDAAGAPIDEEDRGLVYDVRTLVDRRRLLGLFGGITATALLAACSSPETSTPSSAATTPPTNGASATPTPTAAASGPPTEVLGVRGAATGTALAGAAVYLWHCDRDGRYSLYSSGAENENYLRGGCRRSTPRAP